MKYLLVVIMICLTGCASSLPDIDYVPVNNLETVLPIEKVKWEIPSPKKPDVTYTDDYVILNREQFAQVIDLYKYALAQRQDADRLISMSNAVIKERNELLALAKQYEEALNASQFNLSQERSDRQAEEQAKSLQLLLLRLVAAGAIGYAL